jgi:hypothetical protein
LAKSILAGENYAEEAIRAAEFANNPAWFIAKGSNPRLEDLMPGARVLEAMDLDGRPTVSKAPMGENIQLSEQLFQMEKQETAEGLILRDFTQNTNESGMTETLVAERRAALDNQMKPIINRWSAQDLNPTVRFILKYLSSRKKVGGEKGYSAIVEFPYDMLGILPEEMPNPAESLGIYYEGLLGRQQDRYEDYMIMGAAIETAQMAQANPEQAQGALRNINLDKAVRSKIGLKHFRTDILRSEEELQAMAEQDRRQAAAQQMQAQRESAAQMVAGQ